MEIRRIPISAINPAPYNPRKDLRPGDPEYEALKRSIDEFGYVDPVIWNERTGNLVGGHQRFKILVARGDTEVDVSVVDLDDAREKALNVALNKIAGDWDAEKLTAILAELTADTDVDATLTGFTQAEIGELLAEAVQDDDGEEEPFDLEAALSQIAEPRCKPGEVWQLGRHRLICGDSTDPETWRKLLAGAKLDHVVTSAPYNVGIKYRTYQDRKEREDYLQLIRAVGQRCFEILKPGRFIAWNMGVSPDSFPHYQVVVLEECGFAFYRQIIWKKTGVAYPIFPFTVRKRRARYYTPNYQHEVVYLLEAPAPEPPEDLSDHTCPICDGDGKVYGHVGPETHGMLVLMGSGEADLGGLIKVLKQFSSDVWAITQSLATVDIPTLAAKETGFAGAGPKANRHSVKAHPAAFPVKLPEVTISFYTAEGESVGDPFGGAGATLMAAERTGRIAYLSELDPVYCELAMQRWEAATGQVAVHIDE